jgi:surfactin synthase thioesterase subunit
LLADALAPAITPYLDRPFALFGHSMGGIVIFELLRRLKAVSAPEPVSVFISGCRAPNLVSNGKCIWDLPEPEFADELRSLGGTPEEVLADRELFQLLLPTLRADFEASQTYDYVKGSRIPCPAFVYGGMQDSEVTREDLEAWQDECGSSFRLRLFPGNHFFLHTSQVTLLRVLSIDLLGELRSVELPS